MFDFMNMLGNHESRAVDRFEQDDIIVDTCSVTDGEKKYETAICHPYYNKDKFIIVEAYSTKEEAQKGHDKWVKTINVPDEQLPEYLEDCCNADISQLAIAVGNEYRFYKTIPD